MNTEQKKFKDVIKKRRTRALRKLHPREKYKWTKIEVPQPEALMRLEYKSWFTRLIDKIKLWLKKE